MELKIGQLIAGTISSKIESCFTAYNPATGEALNPSVPEASVEEVEAAVNVASEAFESFSKTTGTIRASFLEAIANNIDALGDQLLDTAHLETALPLARLTGERGRTTSQLKLFANLVKNGNWKRAIVDGALPERQPLPRPDLRQMQIPLGVVAIFGSSNFPLAFSVAGGDTAAALAAGCPVVFKAHPAHPSTSQLIGEAIVKAGRETGIHAGVFSMVHGFSNQVGSDLVSHPLVKAVAFTGSFKGGKALYDLCVKRNEPIPVYAEMGSVNPVFFLPNAIEKNGEQLAKNFAASIAQGSGQFCTNPGLFVLLNSEKSKKFISDVSEAIAAITLHPMLTKKIADGYHDGIKNQLKLTGAKAVSKINYNAVAPSIVQTTCKHVLDTNSYFDEVFGPSSLAVIADDMEEVKSFIEKMPGQLTATIHASEKEISEVGSLVEKLQHKVGRIVFNSFPTGVEVCNAMVHGGPFPASTDSRSTSVGTTSIYRFVRPVCYQGFPDELLPDELKKANPLHLMRLENDDYKR